MAGWDDPAGRIRELEAEVHQLRTGALLAQEALCWDRPYDTRIDAARDALAEALR